jgi:hypothetical protein
MWQFSTMHNHKASTEINETWRMKAELVTTSPKLFEAPF